VRSNIPFALPLVISLIVTASQPLRADSPRWKIPQEFKPLFDAGIIEFQFYDPAVERRRYPGRTDFLYDVKAEFRWSARYIERNNRRYLLIKPKIRRLNFTMKHTVSMPRSYDRDDMWETKLLRHELDHVAIGSDPRLEMLMRHLLSKINVIEEPVPPPQIWSDEMIHQRINQELLKRRDAILQIVNAGNRRLDTETLHGARKFPDRDAFFLSLYTKATLDDLGFPYLGDVVGLFRNRKYDKPRLLHHTPSEQDATAP